MISTDDKIWHITVAVTMQYRGKNIPNEQYLLIPIKKCATVASGSYDDCSLARLEVQVEEVADINNAE